MVKILLAIGDAVTVAIDLERVAADEILLVVAQPVLVQVLIGVQRIVAVEPFAALVVERRFGHASRVGELEPARQRAIGDARIVAALDHEAVAVDQQFRIEVLVAVVAVVHLDADAVAPTHQERPQDRVGNVVRLDAHGLPHPTREVAGQLESVVSGLDTRSAQVH